MNKIRYIVVDVDGTLTDGGIYLGNNGLEFKRFCVKDGFGMVMSMNKGVNFIIITGRESKCLEYRAKELKIENVFQGVKDKYKFLKEYIKINNIKKEDLWYIGDDLNDLKAMSLANFIACPLDACDEIKSIADYISEKKAGYGAVRDILDKFIINGGIDEAKN